MSGSAGEDPNSFRDNIATADQSGKRIWVYPRKPSGRLYNARIVVAIFLLIVLFVAPFIKLNGQPLILLDILSRNFIIFGLVFRPQDIYLLVLAVLTLAVFVVQFTAIFGRLFCGWICPQTIFMEMVFRPIEYLIDGSPSKQRKLREGPWNETKLFKWVLKQGIFFALSFVICNLFLAYIIGVERLFAIITDPPSEHIGGLTAMIIFTLLFYGVFSWFREQACTLACPYGRLQGVLLDSNSIAVMYDHTRGEPRAKFSKKEDRAGKGDCIQCRACVAVCPTGIDIRNGSQLECVNCTACIDACNSVMRKVGFDEGLIRYSSEDRLEGKKGFRLRGRVVVYSVALLALMSLLTTLLIIRTEVQTNIFRTPGTLYYETETGAIRNLYSVKMVNKSFDRIPIQLRLKAPAGATLSMVGGDVILEPEGFKETAFFVEIERDQLFGPSALVLIEVIKDGEVIDEIKSNFMGPGAGGGDVTEKRKKSGWGVGILAVYAGFVIFILALVLYASIQDVQLVEESYYEKGLAYQNRIDRRDRAIALDQTLTITQDIRNRQIVISLPQADSAVDLNGIVRLLRPSNSRLDRTLPLGLGPDTIQFVTTDGLTRGLWVVEVDWIMDTVEYYTESRILIP